MRTLAPLASVVVLVAWSCSSSSGDGTTGGATAGQGGGTASSSSASGAGGGGGGGCPDGYGDCDGLAENGCETFLVTHAKHCGSCAQACPTSAHSSATCVDSKCQLTCSDGFLDCNMMAGDGCEAAQLSDPKNCGACGQICATTSCVNGVCKPLELATAQAHPYDLAIDTDYVYWVNEGNNFNDDGTLARVSKKGGKVEVLATALLTASSVAVGGSNVYWTSYGNDLTMSTNGGVFTMAKTGGMITQLAKNQLAAGAIAVDADNAYFVSAGTPAKKYQDGEIRMVPLKGGNVVTLATAQTAPNFIAPGGAYLYWVDLGLESNMYLDSSIWRISLKDPSPKAEKLNDKLPFVNQVAVDATQLFYAQAFLGGIYRMNLAGGMGTLVGSTKLNPFSLDLDPTNVYFGATEPKGTGSIHRVPKAGGKPFQLAAMSAIPYGLAVDDTRVYWADFGPTDASDDGTIYATTK